MNAVNQIFYFALRSHVALTLSSVVGLETAPVIV